MHANQEAAIPIPCAFVFALAFAISLAPIPAAATAFCGIKKTADGFVALRAQPHPKARLIARMHAGDEVLEDGGVEPRNGWVLVTWWRGGRFKFKHAQGNDSPNGRGWVLRALTGDDCG